MSFSPCLWHALLAVLVSWSPSIRHCTPSPQLLLPNLTPIMPRAPLQRWAVALELAAARVASSEAAIKVQAGELDGRGEQLSRAAAAATQQESQLDSLSRDLAQERAQLERLASQLEVRRQAGCR